MEKVKYKRFWLWGKVYLDMGQCIISAEKYYDLRRMKVDETIIKMDHAITWENLAQAQTDRIRKELQAYPKIKSIRDLIQYIRDLIGEDEYEKIKKQTKGKSIEDTINAFPQPYCFILRAYRAQKARDEANKKRELESLGKTLVKNDEGKDKDYDPDAFTEVGYKNEFV